MMPVDRRDLGDDWLSPPPPCPSCGGMQFRRLQKPKVSSDWELKKLHGSATLQCSNCRHVFSYDTKKGTVLGAPGE